MPTCRNTATSRSPTPGAPCLLARPQLVGEARAWYQQHPDDWWELSPEAEALAVEARENRRQTSIYQGELAQWLRLHPRQETTWEELAREFLEAPRDRWGKALQMEIAKALRGLGWRPRQERRDGAKKQIWRP